MMVTERVGGVVDRGSGEMVDYSPQWAEYYRSLGMVREAEIIEQQMSAKAQSRQGDHQQDYSAQWAEYYRSVQCTVYSAVYSTEYSTVRLLYP